MTSDTRRGAHASLLKAKMRNGLTMTWINPSPRAKDLSHIWIVREPILKLYKLNPLVSFSVLSEEYCDGNTIDNKTNVYYAAIDNPVSGTTRSLSLSNPDSTLYI
jgi:hypothetical protein